MTNWFTVDRAGLAQLLGRRGRQFIVHELIQNAWDEDVTRVTVTLEHGGRRSARLDVVDDSPEGFSDLADAFTLFAASKKKGDPTKRGRFNIGEKLVIACCTWAQIETTTGTVTFDKSGRRQSRGGRTSGSAFSGEIRMSQAECREIIASTMTLIPPAGVVTTVNGETIRPRLPAKAFRAPGLVTEKADADGALRRTRRGTEVRVYDVPDGETAHLYEMGIPVVELDAGDRWHIDVQQKVPLTLDRENVLPSFLRDLRVRVLNEMHDELTTDDANAGWAREAAESDDVAEAAFNRSIALRHGEKRVTFDPSDPLANATAVAQGYTVIKGSQMSRGEWSNAKRFGASTPAGRLFPTPKPSPDAPECRVCPTCGGSGNVPA